MRLNLWMDRSSLRVGLGIAALLAVGGCMKRAETTAPEPQYAAPPGGEAPSSTEPTKKSAEDESFTTLDQAERALLAAEGELASLFAPAQTAAQPAAPPPPPPAPAGGAAPPRRDAPPKAEALDSEAQPMSRCELACKAFSSLERAAEAVCRLAGADDARCTRARGAVDDNRRRVASCSCAVSER
jgi:hypothetical protein